MKQHTKTDQGILILFAIQDSFRGKCAEIFKARVLKLRCLKYTLTTISSNEDLANWFLPSNNTLKHILVQVQHLKINSCAYIKLSDLSK